MTTHPNMFSHPTKPRHHQSVFCYFDGNAYSRLSRRMIARLGREFPCKPGKRAQQILLDFRYAHPDAPFGLDSVLFVRAWNTTASPIPKGRTSPIGKFRVRVTLTDELLGWFEHVKKTMPADWTPGTTLRSTRRLIESFALCALAQGQQ